MKNQIIKSYTDWLLESISLNEDFDQATIQQLVKAQDLDKLYELLVATDDEATKALPNYQAIINWWKRGSADLNVLQRFVKTTTAANSDKLNSANSMYYWMGGKVGAGGTGDANVKRSTQAMSNIELLLKELETTSARISAISPTDPKFKKIQDKDAGSLNTLTTTITGWKNVPAIVIEIQTFIDLIKSKGLMFKPESIVKIISNPADLAHSMQVNNIVSGTRTGNTAQMVPFAQYFKQYADRLTATGSSSINWCDLGNSISQLNLDTVKKGIAEATAALNSTKTVADYFIAGSTMSFENKQAIMAAFKVKIDDKVAAYAKGSSPITAEDAINLATNLSILPKGSTITVQPSATPESPVVTKFDGSFPATDGDWKSDQVKKAINYFEDDSIDIKPAIRIEIMAAVKATVDGIIADGGKITAVRVSGEASTSVVPSSYDKATKKPTKKPADYSAAKNVDLVNDRLTAIKEILTTAFNAAGVEEALIQPYPTNDTPLANNGDGTTYDSTKYRDKDTNPTVKAAYEEAFGKWRFAVGSWEIDVSASSTEPQLTAPTSTTSSAWDISISWANESIKVPRKWKNTLKTFFNFKRQPGGAPKKTPVNACSKRMGLTR